MLKLINTNPTQLASYVGLQIETFFPDGDKNIKKYLMFHMEETLARLRTCINAVRMWKLDEFDYLHSSQYAIFLYFLANTIWKHEKNIKLCNKLFFLNKIMNGIDCFYEIEMPEIFFIGHSVGIVLAKATYGNYLVLYQNSTIGKNHGIAPIIGERVVLFPNSAVIGDSNIANGTILSQGVSVINQNTKQDSVVYSGQFGKLVFKEPKRPVINDIFRL